MSVSESNNNIRIRTTPLGTDRYVKINLSQNFDFLEILSLRIGQEEIYKKHCSDYGVIVGRVVCNRGVGIPNAKISVFIPVTEDDKEKSLIRAIYPYQTLTDKGYDNIEYNLLPQSAKIDDICHTPVGSFPEKRRILDCDPWCEVYGRYYKFTTSTNNSGDYMIFGVPIGKHTVHVDVDLSDIGYLSQKPYDMIRQGSSAEMFTSYNKFASSTNLRELPQIKTQNKTLNVQPFWGDVDVCEVGINRVDFDLGYNMETTAFFIGSIFGDSEKNSVSKNCRPRKKLGYLNQLITGPGTIEMIRKTPFGGIEVYTPSGNKTIDNDGTWVLQLPMNLEYKVTNEFGELVDSGNPEVGIATKAFYRFKIGMGDTRGFARVRSRAKFLVPNYGDYTFDDTLQDFTGDGRPNWANLEWNGIYTVRQFISRYSNRNENLCKDNNFTGIKDVYEGGSNNPFPYNRYDRNTNPLFWFLCFLATTVLLFIIIILNQLISLWNSLPDSIKGSDIKCVGFDCGTTTLYAPGCDRPAQNQNVVDDENAFKNCIQAQLAEALNVFSYYFTNDWINGTLFAFLFKYKYKKNNREKYCNAEKDMGTSLNPLWVKDQVCNNNDFPGCEVVYKTLKGVIVGREFELFYAAKIDGQYLYPTDIYNLGSSKICDIFGKPKIIENIPPTTFVGLELVSDPTSDEAGMDPLIIDVTCSAVKQSIVQCKNISRLCELGVDPPYPTIVPLDNNSLEEETREIRADLECLNSGQCSLDVQNGDGGFNNDWTVYRRTYYTKDGYKIISFPYDEGNRNKLMAFNGINNSFYFYFGLLPGRTAIDKLVTQYFKPCERIEPCPIIVLGNIKNNKCVGGTSGSIVAIPEGGTPPYQYSWFKGAYSSTMTQICVDFKFSPSPVPLMPNFVQSCTDTISGLTAGLYTVVVKDSVDQICKKTFTVEDPLPFTVEYNYSPFICPGNSNGFIEVLPIGGVPPYTIDWSSGASVPIADVNSFFIYNLSATSMCVHTEVTASGGTPPTLTANTAITSSTIISFETYRPPSTIPLLLNSAPNVYNVPVRFPNIITNSGNAYGNNTITPVGQNDSVFIAPSSGNYYFSLNYDLIYGGNPINNPFLTSILIFNQISNINDPLLAINGQSQQTAPPLPAAPQNNVMVIFAPIYMNAGEIAVVNIGFSNASAYPDDVFGGITWRGSSIPLTPTGLINTGTTTPIGGGVTPSNGQFYVAKVWDSAGQYGCVGFSALTFDITMSCGFTLTGRTTSSCTNNLNGSATWGAVNGGVPPFTYVIQNSTGYFFSATSYSYTFTKTGLQGNTCPTGTPYDVSCIDSCGNNASLSLKVTSLNLRYLGYIRVSVLSQPYSWYAMLYAGSPGNYIYSTSYGGSGTQFYIESTMSQFTYGNWANPRDYWYTLGPSLGISQIQKQATTGEYLLVKREPFNATEDKITFVYRTGSVTQGSLSAPPAAPFNPSLNTGSQTVYICKDEMLMYMSVYVDGGLAASENGNWSIINQDCNKRLTGNFT